MSKVYFKNDGEIDILAVTTFGVSVKDSSAIGFFGTGLKMSISVILRNGGSVTVYSGEDEYTFSTKNQEVRGRDFEFIYMNDERLGFTTQNAKTWESWMAVREILCNCKDEGGFYTTEEQHPEEGHTLVVVEEQDFYKAFMSKSEFMLDNKKPMLVSDGLEIYSGSTNSLFYKGIKIFESNKPYKYTYNLLSHVDLTEDRTMKYEYYENNCTLASKILNQIDPDFIYNILNCGEHYREYSLEFSAGEPSEVFMEQLLAAKTVNLDMPQNLFKFKPSVSDNLAGIPDSTLNKIQQSQLDKACRFLTECGYSSGYPVRILDDLGKGLMGLADRKTNTIYVSKKAFAMGTKYIAATIYEEFIHLYHGVDDETRAFQDVVIQDLMTMIEFNKGESF